MNSKKHLLFLCSSNLDRSPAAEALFKESDKYEAKSAGVGPFAGTRITDELIDWADHIFVMDEADEKHKSILTKKIPNANKKEITILKISNNYCRNDHRLLKILRLKVSNWLKDYYKDETEANRLLKIESADWIDI